MKRIALILVIAFLAVACSSGGGGDGPEIAAAGGGEVNVGELDDTGDTVPLEEDDTPAILQLGGVLGAFTDCLDAAGFPDADLTRAQTDFESLEPGLQDALARCNTETGLIELFDQMAEEAENLTPEQIEAQNIGLTAFRECTIKNGWEWGELVPNEDGLLSFGTPGEGPAGMDLPEIIELCQPEATAAVEEADLDIDVDLD